MFYIGRFLFTSPHQQRHRQTRQRLFRYHNRQLATRFPLTAKLAISDDTGFAG